MLRMIPVAYGTLGAFSLVFQTILLREFFTVAAGNEISFAVALAAWLLGVGAGSFSSGLWSSEKRRFAPSFSGLVIWMCVSAPLFLVAVRCLHQLSNVPQGALIPLSQTFWLIPLLTMPFSFCSGFVFPLAVKLEANSARRAAQKMVSAYIWECIGAMVAGIMYTFWLLGRFNSVYIIAIFTLPLLSASTCLAAGDKRMKTLAVHVLLLFFNLYALVAGAADKLDHWLVQQHWLGLSGATWVDSRDSKYQNLQLGMSHGQYSLFSNGQLAAVFPNDDPQRIQAAQILTQHPLPQRVLIIGEGASGLARQLLRYRISHLTAVEIDGELLNMIVTHLPADAKKSLLDPRLRLEVLDGRRFVRTAAGKPGDPEQRYDLVFLNQPDASTAQLNRYYTRELFMDVRAILSPGGVVALQLTSAENYSSEISTPYAATVYQTLKSVFPALVVAPGPVNFFFASSAPASISTDPSLLAERYHRLADLPADLGAIFSSLYPEEKTSFIKKALEQYPVRALNRDQQPIAYFLYSRLLGWTSGSPLAGWFDFFAKLKFGSLLLFSLALLCPAVFLVALRQKKVPGNFSVMLAAASGGFAGLALETLTIFTFQNIWGYVYQSIGLLIAVFMLGLGAGAWLTGRYLKNRQPSRNKARKILAGAQMLIALACLTCQPLTAIYVKMPGPTGLITLFTWLAGIGFLVGAILPLGIHSVDRDPTAKIAGLLNGADYVGGASGALVMASFFLPRYGSANSLLLVALPALTAALLLWLESKCGGPA